MTRDLATLILAVCCAVLVTGCQKGSDSSQGSTGSTGDQAPAVSKADPVAAEPEPVVEVSPVVEELVFEDPAPLTLEAGEQLQRTIEVVDAESYAYRVQARSAGEVPCAQRIQAVWLFEGGWGVTDEDGELLRQVVSKRVEVAPGPAQDFELEIERPDGAVTLVIFVVNEGEAAIDVSGLAVLKRS